MALPILKSLLLIEELPTDGHAPMKFLCEDRQVYYCKYRKAVKQEEIDMLGYEVICHSFLRQLGVPTPSIALIELQDGSFDAKRLFQNRKYAKPGCMLFGSLEVPGADLVRDTELIRTERDFSKFENAADLIRIAVFDLWVNNIDRGRSINAHAYNYNLLTAPVGKKKQIIAFDHAFAFGGESGLRFYNPRLPFSAKDRLITSPFFVSIVKHIPHVERLNIAHEFLHLCCATASHTISNAFRDFSPTWQIPLPLEKRMVTFLSDQPRLDQIKAMIDSCLKAF